MQPIRSFVVRVYRQGRSGFAGTVEDVKTGQSQPFRSTVELWAALFARPPKAPRRKKPVPTSEPSAD
ncbi:hypothetical protein [Arenimonas sp.]|uniref:hypothetical protein n=1 Tax=Arenimonas sp. TaxID=1872635 RepID=UPI0039E48370